MLEVPLPLADAEDIVQEVKMPRKVKSMKKKK